MMKYDTYKDSGIKWLGEIPKHWQTDRVKNLGTINGRVGWKALKASEYVDEGYFFLSTPNIKGVQIDFKNVNYITKERYFESPEIMLKIGDILLVKDGSTLGIVNVIRELPSQGTVNSSIGIIRIPKTDSIYWYYYFQSSFIQNFIQIKKDGMGVPHLFQRDIKNFDLLIPPFSEQKAIAQYLNAKTKVIDKKVSLLEKKIVFFTELRKSVINDAVTKGLDNHVELKCSEIGINVAKHWVRYRLKDIGNLYSGLSGKSGEDFRQDDHEHNKGFIPFTNIAANTYIAKDNIGQVLIEPTERQNEVRKGDVFFLMSSEGYEDIGKSSVLNNDLGETYLNSFCKGYRLKSDKHNPHFINYLLLSDSYRLLLIVEGKGFTRINLKMEKVNDFFIHVPPTKEEQTAIAHYLDSKTSTIDAIISNVGKQIGHLKELRKTIINDVVTGKIKVVE